MVPFGGFLPTVEVDASTEVLATFISDFPIFPPETSWVREPKSNTPAITIKTTSNGGKPRPTWTVAMGVTPIPTSR
ncbi:hypothetical protein [Rhizobium sp. AN80A]|uniref:hypothetical protein n=1 Tax=Rhizobium sp. AN80A TaxID=3040673 RepID=UPI000DDB1CA2|nr:hypothetical protein [Rhizobium sp. AN80A]